METYSAKEIDELCKRKYNEGSVLFYQTHGCSKCLLNEKELQKLNDSYNTYFKNIRIKNKATYNCP
jgi:hypothetical protein